MFDLLHINIGELVINLLKQLKKISSSWLTAEIWKNFRSLKLKSVLETDR